MYSAVLVPIIRNMSTLFLHFVQTEIFITVSLSTFSPVASAAAPLAAFGRLQVRMHRLPPDGRRARHRRLTQGVRQAHRRHRGREGQNGICCSFRLLLSSLELSWGVQDPQVSFITT